MLCRQLRQTLGQTLNGRFIRKTNNVAIAACAAMGAFEFTAHLSSLSDAQVISPQIARILNT